MKTALHPGQRHTAWGRLSLTGGALVVAGLATYFFGDRLENGVDILLFIATIFSILAGVLIAVISILGDPSMLLDQSWRHSYLSAQETQRKIHRQNDIFVVYILLLVALFIFLITGKDDAIYGYVQHTVFFLTVFAFLTSLSLPYVLKGIQKDRLDRAIGQIATKKN